MNPKIASKNWTTFWVRRSPHWFSVHLWRVFFAFSGKRRRESFEIRILDGEQSMELRYLYGVTLLGLVVLMAYTLLFS